MSDNEVIQELTLEERLKAIAYQFIALYERWSEDRQLAAKQGADTAELVKLFTEQVKNFKTLESSVREQLRVSIQQAVHQSTQKISEKVDDLASQKLEHVNHKLTTAADHLVHRLQQQEQESFKMTGIFLVVIFVMCILVSFMVGKWAVPQPYLPLSEQDLQTYQNGLLFNSFWPNLSKKEQKRLEALAERRQDSGIQDSNSTDNEEDSTTMESQ